MLRLKFQSGRKRRRRLWKMHTARRDGGHGGARPHKAAVLPLISPQVGSDVVGKRAEQVQMCC